MHQFGRRKGVEPIIAQRVLEQSIDLMTAFFAVEFYDKWRSAHYTPGVRK